MKKPEYLTPIVPTIYLDDGGVLVFEVGHLRLTIESDSPGLDEMWLRGWYDMHDEADALTDPTEGESP